MGLGLFHCSSPLVSLHIRSLVCTSDWGPGPPLFSVYVLVHFFVGLHKSTRIRFSHTDLAFIPAVGSWGLLKSDGFLDILTQVSKGTFSLSKEELLT